jgi:twitching motility two-component system response regulator PilH
MLEPMEKKIIYVLDDDEAILILLEKILSNLGMAVETFSTIELFVNGLKIRRPDLCFIDLNLGSHLGAGFQLTEALRKKNFDDIILIAISSRSTSEDITYALQHGFDDYIIKPINKILIENKLRQHFSAEITDTIPMQPVPPALAACSLDLDSFLYSIGETEFTILTPHLLPPNAEIEFQTGKLFDIIKKKIKLHLYYSWQHQESGLHAATFHFPEEDLELKNNVMKWIVENKAELQRPKQTLE